MASSRKDLKLSTVVTGTNTPFEPTQEPNPNADLGDTQESLSILGKRKLERVAEDILPIISIEFLRSQAEKLRAGGDLALTRALELCFGTVQDQTVDLVLKDTHFAFTGKNVILIINEVLKRNLTIRNLNLKSMRSVATREILLSLPSNNCFLSASAYKLVTLASDFSKLKPYFEFANGEDGQVKASPKVANFAQADREGDVPMQDGEAGPASALVGSEVAQSAVVDLSAGERMARILFAFKNEDSGVVKKQRKETTTSSEFEQPKTLKPR